MNLLDRAIASVAPGLAADRLRSRMMIRAYEAAKPSRLNRAKSEHRSANEAVLWAGKSLREQARWLDENHDLVVGLLDRLEERIVGRGIGVEPLPVNADGEVNTEVAAQIKALWSEWSVRPDVSQTMTRPQLERMACRSWLRDGEVFAQHVSGNVQLYQFPHPVKYAIEALEADYVPFDYERLSDGIRQGIQFNTWKQPTNYWVYKGHPNDTVALTDQLKQVPAREMIHLAHRKRLEQFRGVSILAPVLKRLADLKEYEESERVAARIAAALTMYIRKGDASLFTPPTGDDEQYGARTIPIAPGMVFDGLEPGEDVGMLESNRPSALLEGFRNAMLRAVAAGTRVSYSSMARDYNGTYSAQRQELVESEGGYSVMQAQFIDSWCRPIYRRFVASARASGALQLPRGMTPEMAMPAIYTAPQMPWIDPKKEAEGWSTLVRNGFADQQEVVRARGRDLQELLRNREQEVSEAARRGLQFDSDPASESAAPAASDEEPNDDNQS